MQDFDNAVQQAEEQIRLAQSKTAAVTEAFAESKVADSETIPIDIENASLQDVEAHNEAMNANIAELIIGLDEVTAGFSKEFEAMRDAGKALKDHTLSLHFAWWPTGWYNASVVDSFVVRLRRYLEPDPSRPRHIVSVRGRGYRFLRE